jgi:hypothetical protein
MHSVPGSVWQRRQSFALQRFAVVDPAQPGSDRNSQLFSVSKSRNARNLLRDLAEPSRDGFAALQTVT